eukprot:5633645-Prymnesium_polylepis.1
MTTYTCVSMWKCYVHAHVHCADGVLYGCVAIARLTAARVTAAPHPPSPLSRATRARGGAVGGLGFARRGCPSRAA